MGLFGKKYLIEHPEKFETEEKEVIVLCETEPGGSRVNIAGDKLWSANVPLLGCIDCGTNELMEKPRYLTWNYEDGGSRNVHGIKKFGTYRLKVRFSLPCEAPFGGEVPAGRSLFVVKVLKRNVSEPRLREILEEYKKPVFIETANGDNLELDRSMGMYGGNIKWRDTDIDVSLSVDDGGETCEGALEAFNVIMSNPASWERKAKLYAAMEMTENANDWQESQEGYTPITETDFAKRITLGCISISEDGDLEFWFDDDEMFFGHSIVVYGNTEEGFNQAEMVG